VREDTLERARTIALCDSRHEDNMELRDTDNNLYQKPFFLLSL